MKYGPGSSTTGPSTVKSRTLMPLPTTVTPGRGPISSITRSCTPCEVASTTFARRQMSFSAHRSPVRTIHGTPPTVSVASAQTSAA